MKQKIVTFQYKIQINSKKYEQIVFVEKYFVETKSLIHSQYVQYTIKYTST